MRLDVYLARLLRPEYSRSYLGDLIRRRLVAVNDKVERPAYRVQEGDRIVARLVPPPSAAPRPEERPLRVLYDDEHLVVLDKPAGWIVHPVGAARGGTLVNALLFHYPEIEKVGVVSRPGIVHRLDRLTSGVMVVARTGVARKGLVDQFRRRQVKKEYLALVVGKVPFRSDYVDLPIGDDPRRPERRRIDLRSGKPASTFYEVEERLPGFTLLRVQPLTGRTHQIRLHLAHLGHPVVADGLYGKSTAIAYQRFRERQREAGRPVPRLERQALHALRLRFTHPVDGRQLSLEAPLPEDFEELLSILRATPSG